jgi:glycosyltransferase involved in cell wall biosynthesis
MQDNVVLSVIVPTHNRYNSVKELLEMLSQQTFPIDRFEVIVVADGCTDETCLLKKQVYPFLFTFCQLEGSGAAVARNYGAKQAKGELLLFLDDDIQPASCLIEKHVQAHNKEKDVVIGYLPLSRDQGKGLFRMTLRSWWEEKFYQMSFPGYRFGFDDLLSGNFSIAASFFASVGGFNPSFICCEDYELGVRLVMSGATFRYEKEACGWHNDIITDLKRSLQRKREEGRAHIAMCRLYPGTIYRLKLGQYTKYNYSRKLQFLLKNPNISALLTKRMVSLMDWYDRNRFRGHWKRLNHLLHDYCYLKGALDHFASVDELQDFIDKTKAATIASPALTIDLKQGIRRTFEEIDLLQPDSVQLQFGSFIIGRMPYSFTEPIKSIHLKHYLLKNVKENYIKALSLDAQFTENIFSDRSEVRFEREEKEEYV